MSKKKYTVIYHDWEDLTDGNLTYLETIRSEIEKTDCGNLSEVTIVLKQYFDKYPDMKLECEQESCEDSVIDIEGNRYDFCPIANTFAEVDNHCRGKTLGIIIN